MSLHAALVIPSPSTISFGSSCSSRSGLDARELIATLETIDELRRRDSAVSKDDSRIDYTSVLNIEDKKRRFSEDLVDCDTKSSIQMKKIYRQIQRQVHCDENTEPSLAWAKQTENNCIRKKDFNLKKYSNQDKLHQLEERKFSVRPRSKSVHTNRSRQFIAVSEEQKVNRSQSLKYPTKNVLCVEEIMEIIEEAGSELPQRAASVSISNASRRRREKQKKSRATVFITSGAMTFIVLAATLVTATFLFSPTIEEIFVMTNLNLTEDSHGSHNNATTFHLN